MNLAIFDIDGTLTETNAVDEICFVQAFADAHSITRINTNWMEYRYVTDSGIMFQIFHERFVDQLESLIHGGYVHLCFPNGFLFCVLPEKALSEKRDGITEPPYNTSLSCIA